ncbi:rhodanese-like domain-containing protein [Egibacter rhizosphaerae]|uniref:rhodanese-like domain-containing protein n=1 Tax=Egibacter rhizosphaerae TaxID=1670831 RepID=UPI00197AC417|nr:rhodanese-like domain-containing protein [Egibacter rhizosphaerae]
MVLALVTSLVLATVPSRGDGPDAPRDLPEPEGAAEFAERSASARLIDVRTPAEYADGHLSGAELIDVQGEDFRERVEELPRDEPYYLYCRSGNRSGHAARVMAAMGFADVTNIGGYEKLVEAGLSPDG